MPVRECLSCGRTFGVLPQGLLPVMRWFLSDVQLIARQIEAGVSSRQLADRLSLSPGIIRRLRARLPKLEAITQRLSLAAGIPTGVPMEVFTGGIEFIRQLSHALYPRLHLQIPRPHEM